ncbi:putative membrane protein [Vibrio parahaemolyticus VPCR-2010]|uniref:hypothetical protein n=1 Tax=Vibrio parahaemolyticus TaxID=670 RepID=UPI00038E563A|nr:putative membrane protein [Vibrio parahaemolyticus VPCR-2010]
MNHLDKIDNPIRGFKSFSALIFLSLLVISGYLTIFPNYYPSEEDISLISQQSLLSLSEWFTYGYRDWFTVMPGFSESSVFMYEIRPMTHFYAYIIYLLFGMNYEFWIVINLVCILFLNASLIYTASSLKLNFKQTLLSIIIFWVFNPALSTEIFKEIAFTQVILEASLFSLLIGFSINQKIKSLILVVFISCFLKESTILFGLVSASLVYMHMNKNSIKIPLLIFSIHIITYFSIRPSILSEEKINSVLNFFSTTSETYSIKASIFNAFESIIKNFTASNVGSENWLLISILIALFILFHKNFAKLSVSESCNRIKTLSISYILLLPLCVLFSGEMRWLWSQSINITFLTVISLSSMTRRERIFFIISAFTLITLTFLEQQEISYAIYSVLFLISLAIKNKKSSIIPIFFILWFSQGANKTFHSILYENGIYINNYKIGFNSNKLTKKEMKYKGLGEALYEAKVNGYDKLYLIGASDRLNTKYSSWFYNNHAKKVTLLSSNKNSESIYYYEIHRNGNDLSIHVIGNISDLNVNELDIKSTKLIEQGYLGFNYKIENNLVSINYEQFNENSAFGFYDIETSSYFVYLPKENKVIKVHYENMNKYSGNWFTYSKCDELSKIKLLDINKNTVDEFPIENSSGFITFSDSNEGCLYDISNFDFLSENGVKYILLINKFGAYIDIKEITSINEVVRVVNHDH